MQRAVREGEGRRGRGACGVDKGWFQQGTTRMMFVIAVSCMGEGEKGGASLKREITRPRGPVPVKDGRGHNAMADGPNPGLLRSR